MSDEKLTDAEAEAMLRRLRSHYRQPVLPLHRVCDALTKWSEVSGERMPIGAIYKSNLLHRMLYLGEKLRTIKCPAHNGRWSGCKELGTCACQSGWNVTGWLPDAPLTEQQEIEAMRESPIQIITLPKDGDR